LHFNFNKVINVDENYKEFKSLKVIIMKEFVDILIKNGIIVTVNQKDEIIVDGAIAIKGNKIIAVGKSSDIEKDFKSDILIDAKNKAVLPGFINAHTHECLLRGLCEDLPLMEWLNKLCFPMENAFSEEHMRASALLNQLEMIKSGTTTFIDIYRHEHKAAEVVEKSGLRAILAPQLADLLPCKMENINDNERLLRDWNGKANGRIRVWFGPHAPYSCSTELLMKVKELAEKYKTGIHIHLSESKDEVQRFIKYYGKRPIEFMNDLKFLNSNVHAAHCVWLNEKEIEILKRNKVSVAYNPTSNMKLASGIAPIMRLLQASIVVGLGTDSILSNNNLDMIEEMRFASFLQRVHELNATALPANKVLRMATIEGAKCLRMENEVGSIEVGKKADIILIDLNKPHLSPLFLKPITNIIEQIVYSASGSDVDTVIVDGKILMENRKVKSLEECEVIEEAQKAALDLYRRIK
jgi:5-methylthioadenosine/S-adenosylhomocysteine deaminase